MEDKRIEFDIPKIIKLVEKLQTSLEWEKKAEEKTAETGMRHGHYKCPKCGEMQITRHKTEMPFECRSCDFKAEGVAK